MLPGNTQQPCKSEVHSNKRNNERNEKYCYTEFHGGDTEIHREFKKSTSMKFYVTTKKNSLNQKKRSKHFECTGNREKNLLCEPLCILCALRITKREKEEEAIRLTSSRFLFRLP
jgi:hypothetical protein